jgi:hypothetical protein
MCGALRLVGRRLDIDLTAASTRNAPATDRWGRHVYRPQGGATMGRRRSERRRAQLARWRRLVEAWIPALKFLAFEIGVLLAFGVTLWRVVADEIWRN